MAESLSDISKSFLANDKSHILDIERLEMLQARLKWSSIASDICDMLEKHLAR